MRFEEYPPEQQTQLVEAAEALRPPRENDGTVRGLAKKAFGLIVTTAHDIRDTLRTI